MGHRYHIWQPRRAEASGLSDPSLEQPLRDLDSLRQRVQEGRAFHPVDRLDYGDYGLDAAARVVERAIKEGRRIALYADYDVDGTMSCVSWIWFLKAVGHQNFIHYIPCRFTEGYGVNMNAVKHLIDEERAELIITMDTGITANEEAAYARSRGVDFICTDHHKIQTTKMPDCIILNPKQHPNPEYQELCGCGVTFVLLRKLGRTFDVPADLWTDLLALAGMATICDVVPLGGVNHKLARMGVEALVRSRRPVLRELLAAARVDGSMDETDVGFRLGPRINAVGRLEHADKVVEAFVRESPAELIKYMGVCNDRRREIQVDIVKEAMVQAEASGDAPVLVLGGAWHPGVVGIAASKIAETFWRPVWLYQRKDGLCKGSARSIPGFDVTEAMSSAQQLFLKFGGHRAAGGFSFEAEREDEVRQALTSYARKIRDDQPDLWTSRIAFDGVVSSDLLDLSLADAVEGMRPFGHGFEEPLFCLESEILRVDVLNDRVTGEPKHMALMVRGARGLPQKMMLFNDVVPALKSARRGRFLVSASRNRFRDQVSLQLTVRDLLI